MAGDHGHGRRYPPARTDASYTAAVIVGTVWAARGIWGRHGEERFGPQLCLSHLARRSHAGTQNPERVHRYRSSGQGQQSYGSRGLEVVAATRAKLEEQNKVAWVQGESRGQLFLLPTHHP